MFDGEKMARVEQPEAGTRDFYVQEGDSIYSPLVSVHDQAADAQYWYLFDALGSTMGLVDANGNLTGTLQYDAFGNVLEESNVPRSAFFKYVGAYQYMPEEFEGMMLLWHRWYDPTVGRFVGRDALEQPGVSSPYPYASAAPCGSDDPPGTVSAVAVAVGVILAWFALCGAIGAGAALVNMYARGDKNDKHAHCIAACEIRKCGTIVQSRLWGYIKEAFDAVFGSGWSAADIKANYIGEGCAVDPRYQRVVCGTKLPPDCVACCNDLA